MLFIKQLIFFLFKLIMFVLYVHIYIYVEKEYILNIFVYSRGVLAHMKKKENKRPLESLQKPIQEVAARTQRPALSRPFCHRML